jgi:hypothetical protein
MPEPTILVIGLGHLGGVTLELLARQDWVGKIIGSSRDPERGSARCNLARLGAMAQGYPADIEYLALDLRNVDQVADTIQRLDPDLILSTASLQTWWLPELLPRDVASRLSRARFGAWLPIHLTLNMDLMRAVRDCEYVGPVLTAPFPDVVNCILDRLGLAPTCGVGNIDEVVPKVRWLAAEKLQTPASDVDVTLVAHHALQKAVFRPVTDPAPVAVPPFHLRIEHAGRDVTEEIGGAGLLLEPSALPGGPAWGFLTAGSTVRLVGAFLSKNESPLHAPAPGGLPGGYPVFVGNARVRPRPLDDLSPGEAIQINERSHPFDGIHAIEDDGTTVFEPVTVHVLREELGYDCTHLLPQEAAERAGELIDRFREYARKAGVDLEPTH